MRRSVHLDAAGPHGVEKTPMAEADASERFDFSVDLEAHLIARIEEAQIGLGALQYEPEQAVLVSAKSKERDDPFVGECIDANHSAQRPHEEIRIEVLVGEIFRGPSVAPRSERFDHGAELAPRNRETILMSVSLRRRQLLDDAASTQRLKSLGEEIPRHPGDAPLDVGEAAGRP